MKLVKLFQRLWQLIGARDKEDLTAYKKILNNSAKIDLKLITEIKKLIDKGYL
jgi:hypothetical protein